MHSTRHSVPAPAGSRSRQSQAHLATVEGGTGAATLPLFAQPPKMEIMLGAGVWTALPIQAGSRAKLEMLSGLRNSTGCTKPLLPLAIC